MEKILKSKLPHGDFGIWIVVYIELITFGAFFIGYAFSRRAEIEVFNQSQLLLNQNIGFVNTIILLTSSYFVVQAVEAIKKLDTEKAIGIASKYLLYALLLGLVFLLLKVFEISDKYSQGINLSTNTFFMFYIILIVFHFLHVVLGVIILFNVRSNTKLGLYTQENYQGLVSGAIYWHLVDLLWIVLFPLVYIMR